MKQIKRLKRGKISLFLAAAVLSLGILSGCGAESKEAKEARMTGIEQLNAGNYQDAIDSFGKALDESDGIVNSFELDVLKYRGEAEYKLADYKAAAQTYGILAEVDGGKAEYLYYKAASEAAAGQAEDAEKDFAAAEEKAKNSKKSSAARPRPTRTACRPSVFFDFRKAKPPFQSILCPPLPGHAPGVSDYCTPIFLPPQAHFFPRRPLPPVDNGAEMCYADIL